MIPLQFAAVSNDSIGTVVSKTCDNDDSFPVLGQAEMERVSRCPPPHIPDFFKLVDNCSKRFPPIRREKTNDIFKDDPAWLSLSSQVRKLMEEAAPFPFQSLSLDIGVAEVLARPSCAPYICIGYVSRFECKNVVMQRRLRPVPPKHHLAMWIYFALEHHIETGPLKAQIKPAYARKK